MTQLTEQDQRKTSPCRRNGEGGGDTQFDRLPGQRIRQLRILRGFASQQAFADALRIAQSHVHKLETSDGLTMQVGTLLKIARKLRVKPGALLDTQDYRAAVHQIASEQAEAEEQNATWTPLFLLPCLLSHRQTRLYQRRF